MKPSISQVALEFIAYYTGPERHPSGGCGNCGGLPHSATCFVGRFIEALDEGAINTARIGETASPDAPQHASNNEVK